MESKEKISGIRKILASDNTTEKKSEMIIEFIECSEDKAKKIIEAYLKDQRFSWIGEIEK
ncbi:hypothetical protein [Flammeovirga kamogawensis]|uniref:Uncharacterized protein n=1 Tax=Flammeovirga kamogawensis TaxID=373891 RepID=A0ABX8H118_9BACT|nr:hypothetical protein [Flammeovirga kamogawensis]MBB6462296.1 hypothetical protein [Flammeovirga kamogawensis]QWG09314.1 hypothetical protein KM029_22165 [Flammeovirga kamogawensis]TRX64836.1 hypothetical protein EO216_20075 [Flammeovirga kamogawensis]